MLVVVLADALLEGWMRRAEDSSASSGGLRWIASSATPIALALGACGLVALGLERLGALVVLGAGLMGRFHWVALGRGRHD